MAYLATTVDFPEDNPDLLRVAQYIAVMTGSGPLYEKLHELFDADYAPTRVHTLLATIPAYLRRQEPVRYPRPCRTASTA